MRRDSTTSTKKGSLSGPLVMPLIRNFVIFSLSSFKDVSVTRIPDSVFLSDLKAALG
jgi:hypothetical protein